MANFGPSKTWTDGEVLSHTDLNAALLDIINNVTNNNIDADNIDETDDYVWSGANSFTGGHSIKVLSNAAGSIVTGTTLEWDPGDGGQMTDNSSGISLDFKLPDASDNQDIFASIATICLDDAAGSEDGELSFRVATAGTNTEQMTLSSTALTVTPAITASGGVSGSVTSSNATITGGTITGITDIAVADGGTGASTASAARTNLGVAIGSDVQAYDAGLADIAALATTDGNIIVGSGSNWVAESGATARTSLGLGSIATQDANAVSITGGSLTGMTSYSGGTISGSTGAFSSTLAATGATTIGAGQAVNAKALLTLTSTTSAGYGGEIQFHKNSASTAEIGHESAVLGSGFSSDLFLASDGAIDFATGGTTQRMTILSDGKTGIGTASPSRLLHLSSTGGTFARFTSENTDDFSVGANANGFVVYNETDADYPFVITNTGNVGIGTSSPSAKLTVDGGDILVETVRLGENPTSTNNGEFSTFSTGAVTVGTGASSTVDLFTRQSSAASAAGTVYVSCESAGGVRWGYIIDFFHSNNTFTTTSRETGNSQGTTTCTIQENSAGVSVTVTYAGGIGSNISYNAGGHASILNY